MMKRQRGFTLIELLIVVGIIGILSGILVGIINVPEIRKKTRDTQRISDLKKIQVSLELYFSDNVAYPVNLSTLTSGYLDVVPTDPLVPTMPYGYLPVLSGGVYKTYTLAAFVELSQNAAGNCSTILIPSGRFCYGLVNP